MKELHTCFDIGSPLRLLLSHGNGHQNQRSRLNMLLKMMREELMLQWPDGKSGAQFREDGGPDDIVSALQCPVVSHQQGVVERKGQSLGNKRSCTFDKKF